MSSIQRVCSTCHKNPISKPKQYRCKPCNNAYSKKYYRKKHPEIKKDRNKKPVIRICVICNKEFIPPASNLKQGGFTCSRICFYKRYSQLKGGKAKHLTPDGKYGYLALHVWVARQLGKPSVCEFCNTTEAKVYDWSNISGEYKKNIADWQRLCRKCHQQYDNIAEKVAKSWERRRATIKT